MNGCPALDEDDLGQVWEVVAVAADPTGVIVREGQELTSEKVDERLTLGAKVKELELQGERLRFQLLAGRGPGTGWVTVKVREKDLLRRTNWRPSSHLADDHFVRCEPPKAGGGLTNPDPEKLKELYLSPLEYVVEERQISVYKSPSAKSPVVGKLMRDNKVLGFQQGTWFKLRDAPGGWVPLAAGTPGAEPPLRPSKAKLEVARAVAEAAVFKWEKVPARSVQYGIEWARVEDAEEATIGVERETKTLVRVRDLPPESELRARLVIRILTEDEAYGGKVFATIRGGWEDFETERAVDELEEGNNCIDNFSNFRGKCMDCPCDGFVMAGISEQEAHKQMHFEELLCRRCACPCVRHTIIGELVVGWNRRKPAAAGAGAQKPQAQKQFQPPPRKQAALPSGMPEAASWKESDFKRWRPEDAGDGDRVKFVLDNIAEAATLYETLGVPPSAEEKAIRSAYRHISLHIHPDKVQNRGEKDLVEQAEAAFKIVSAAYEVLSDPLKRGAYNQSIRTSIGSSAGGIKSSSTRKDLTAATLLRRFLSKAMWGWDLSAKPPGEWEEYGKGVYGKSRNVNLKVMHAITKEELDFTFDRGATVQMLKTVLIARVKRGPASAIEFATVDGDEIPEDFRFSNSLSLVLAGISSLGPPKDVKLCLSHAHTGARHYITVPDTATIAEIREAAAKSLKVNYRHIRLGCRWNNRDKLHDFEESDLLNGRSTLLVLGVEIPIHLSVEEATELQSELLQAYGEASFQRELDALLAQHPPLDGLIHPAFKERWDYLLKHAQKNILLKHGFDGPHGAITMLAAFHDVNYHPEVQRLAGEIDGKLRITHGTALPPVIPVLIQPADEDCDSDDEVQRGIKVVLLKGSSIGDLKAGIAKKLEEDVSKIEVVTMGKPELFAKKPRSVTVHPDDEALGARRLFQVRGIKMPPQEDLDKTLKEQERHRQQLAAEQAKVRRRDEEAAGWDALKDCHGCKKQLKACRGHISKDDSKWYCNQCWSKHHKMDGRFNAANAILAADSIAATEGSIDRETRRCTTPGCKFRMHRNTRLGAYIYCCIACKEGSSHSFACERRDPFREDTPEPNPEERLEESKEASAADKRALPALADAAKPSPAPAPAPPAAAAAPAPAATAPAPKPVQQPAPTPAKPPAAKPKEEPKLALVPAKASEGPQEVTVEVKSLSRADLTVSLNFPSTTTWLEVKRALAWRIGRPDVLQSGKIVCKDVSGNYSSFEDSKAVNDSCEVFLMNCDLSYNPDSWDIGAEEYKKAEKRRQQPGVPVEKKPAPKEEKEVTISIKDLKTGSGFDMRVLRTMTAVEMRQAIAFATGRSEEELMEGKLLKRGGEGYTSLVDQEIAGDKKSLWTMGVEITPKKGSPAEKLFLRKGAPVVTPLVEKERAAAAALAAKEGDEEGWRLQLEDARDPELVMVTITHATNKNDPPVEVVVMDNCSLADVMQALCERTNRPEVLRLGKFVERKGAASYKGLRPEEPLKKRRELLLHGVDLKPKR